MSDVNKYPRYFCHVNGTFADGPLLICIDVNGNGHVLSYETGEREGTITYQIQQCLDNVRAEYWIEGTRYGPFQSELSWMEYAAVQKVVKRLTGEPNAA